MNQIFQVMQRDLKYYFQTYALSSFAVGLVTYVFFRCMFFGRKCNKDANLKADHCTGLNWALFAAYLYMVLQIVFFSRTAGQTRIIIWKFFGTIHGVLWSWVFLLENIILLLPFGFFMPLLLQAFRNGWKCTGAGMLFSCLIELTQLLTKRGRCELDDIWSNTLGCAVGFGIWKVIDVASKKIKLLFCESD